MGQNALALYIHWPFCKSKCPYCDFNSHVAAEIDQHRWQNAYLSEIDAIAERFPQHTITSVFFGGGTPSLMAPAMVAALLDHIQTRLSLAKTIEITLEANPTSVEANNFKGLKDAGINRLSLGVQSLRQDALAFLGREHTVQEAAHAFDLASRHFSRFSFDLIYARPGQSLKDWEIELTEALDMAGGHLSLYQLTIEPGTRFHKDRVPAIEEKLGEEMFTLTQEITDGRGLPAYEVSNHAIPGEESRHNLTYWQGGFYAGIGPGAHGRLPGDRPFTALATHNWRSPDKWLDLVERMGRGLQKTAPISASERTIELLLMGLRLTKGIKAFDIQHLSGEHLSYRLGQEALVILCDGGFLQWNQDVLKTTAKGRLRLNAVLDKLLN